jgi:hypothetical protein
MPRSRQIASNAQGVGPPGPRVTPARSRSLLAFMSDARFALAAKARRRGLIPCRKDDVTTQITAEWLV